MTVTTKLSVYIIPHQKFAISKYFFSLQAQFSFLFLLTKDCNSFSPFPQPLASNASYMNTLLIKLITFCLH